MKVTNALLALTSLVGLVKGHAHMVEPRTLFMPYDGSPWDMTDYNIAGSLFLNGTNWPCKGYHHSTRAEVENTFTAGSEHEIKINVGAHHSGGTCELSLSYDNGLSFRVFKRWIGGCPFADGHWISRYKIPEFAPSGQRVIFSWTWLALTGNIELWQSCALVNIDALPGKADQRRWDALPSVLRAALYTFSPECKSEDTVHLIPPLHKDVEEEFSRDEHGVVPSRESAPYPFRPGQCDNDDRHAASWAYEKFNGFMGSDCNLEPLVPCTETTGWPSRNSYQQACTRHEPPVGWKEWPIRCGGQGPVPANWKPGDGGEDPGHGGHHGTASGRGLSGNQELKALLKALIKLLESV